VLGLLSPAACSRKKETPSESVISASSSISPAQSKMGIGDPVASFQRGILRLDQRKDEIFRKNCTGYGCVEIKYYDIKKTDSLIMPIVGIIEVKSFEFPTTANAVIHEFLLSYHNARWAVEKYTTRVWSTETGDGDQHFGWKYKTDAEKSVEECFNAE